MKTGKSRISNDGDGYAAGRVSRTQAWCKQNHVQVCDKLLGIRIKHALSSGNVTRQAHEDDLEHCLKDQKE